jgi:hypothetical protein
MPQGFDASMVWLILVSMALGRMPRPARAGQSNNVKEVTMLQK